MHTRYVAWTYWLAVTMVAIFGTMAADVLHVVLGVEYAVSTAFFAIVLAIVFIAWYATERTLSIHSVYAGRREWFNWATVMATFALGTAAGDLAASTLGLGYFGSFLVFLLVFALPGIGYRLLRLQPVFAFWFAYVITRPLGATFADWLGTPNLGGLGLGDGKVAVVLGLLIIVSVTYLSVCGRDTPREARDHHVPVPVRSTCIRPVRCRETAACSFGGYSLEVKSVICAISCGPVAWLNRCRTWSAIAETTSSGGFVSRPSAPWRVSASRSAFRSRAGCELPRNG